MRWATLAMAGLALATPAVAARKKPAPVVVAPPAPPPPSVRQGVELWRAGDWAGAVAMWQPFADAGDADAMFNVGQAHKLGRSVPRDVLVARDWYRKAAMKGHLPAQANLGILLFQAGEKADAVRWLKAAADRNEMRAQYVLGVAHWNGDGVPRSLVLAYAYLARASAQGLAEATNALNNLTATIPPQDRANGWAVALSLAAGTGIPPAYANPGAVQVARADGPAADQVLKPLPRPPVLAPPSVVPPAPRPAPVAPPSIKPAASNQVTLPPPTLTPPPIPTPPPSKPAPVVTTPAPPRPVPVTPPPPPAATAAIVPLPAATVPPKPQPMLTRPVAQVAASVNTIAPPASPPKAAPKPPEKSPEKPPEKLATKPVKPGWRVQLGAFSKKSQAEAAWQDVATKQKALVAKQVPIYAADGNVIKLQMGPYKDKASARDACAKIAFSGRACFVTEG